MQGDGLPGQICTQCIQQINRAYSFKQLCEKSDVSLREYIGNNIHLQSTNGNNLMNDVKSDQLFSNSVVLQQSSFFNDIFNDATSHFNDTTSQSLVDQFSSHNANTG